MRAVLSLLAALAWVSTAWAQMPLLGVSKTTAGGGGSACTVTGTAEWNGTDIYGPVFLTNGNLSVESQSGFNQGRSTHYGTGKCYWEDELTLTTGSTNWTAGGMASSDWNWLTQGLGSGVQSVAVRLNDGVYYNNSATGFGGIMPTAQGQIVRKAVDWPNKLLWVAIADPATGTGGVSISSMTGSNFYAAWSFDATDNIDTANFGATAFTYSAPSGFSAFKP